MVRNQVLGPEEGDGGLGRFDRARIIPFAVMDAGEKAGSDPFIRVFFLSPTEKALGGVRLSVDEEPPPHLHEDSVVSVQET